LEEQPARLFSDNVPGTVRLVHATLAWQSTPPICLSNLTLTIAPGSLVMVVGSVGAGKSSLISAILGEMHLVQGSVDVHGSVALVSQEPWIRNDTVRGNILFEDAYEASWYKTVLQAVQLEADMRLLPAGDKTEIGEQGINLSGGQKACTEHGSNVLLLDDPLSAVDVHVAKAIFDQAIDGLARGKTRIMAMNSHYQFLQRADRIVVMENGSIVGDGTFAELYSAFPQFLNRPSDKARANSPAKLSVVEPHRRHVPHDALEHRKSEASSVMDGDAVLIIEEDRVKGTVGKQTYLDYFSHVGFNGWLVSVSLVVMFGVGQTMRVAVDWWQGHWASQFTTTSVSTSHGIFYGFVSATAFFFFARCNLLVTYTSRCSENMHHELLRCVLRAPINLFFDITPVGRILNRFSRDLDIVDSLLPNLFLDILEYLFVLLGALAICAVSSFYVALGYIPVLVVFYYAGEFFKKSSRELKRLEGVSRSPIFSSFAETLDGIHTIRAFGMTERFTLQNRRAVDTNSKILFALVGSGRWFSIRMDMAATIMITIILAVLVSLKGVISSTVAGLALTYSVVLVSTIQWVIRLFDLAESAMTAVERLLHFKTIPEEAPETTLHDPAFASWPSKGAVQFQNLKLRYRPDLPLVLHGITLDIQGGEKIGICGRTGAGKSSLMIALFRISEFDSGTILIDGMDIATIGLATLRRVLSIIPQDPVLFSGTLRENLDPFGEKTDAELDAVVQQTHLDLALSTVVAESGSNLSVGQRQLLCIGRALLRQSRIIVMDEATANVDLATDQLIQTTIQQAFTTETVLTIAHRLDTILHCDRVVVLEKGQVVECDAPSVLMAQ
ncbi:hypothetical protein AeNC1_017475, partial [Aphanomyces euteiches]